MKFHSARATKYDRQVNLISIVNPHSMNDPDTELMQKALDLARRGAGMVNTNPMVGAVIVKDGRIIGEGFHRYDLIKHAEVHALEMAGSQSRGATIYCSLEPCCNYGRTPPCTDAIIEAGISRVVVATIDPNPRVNGRGLEILRDAGIEVETGLCEDEGDRLIEIYAKFVTTGRPFVHAVIASNIEEWTPTEEFIRLASYYDAIVLSDWLELNSLIIDKLIARERIRPVRVIDINGESVPEHIPAGVEPENVSLLTMQPDFEFIIEQIAQSRLTSLLILPNQSLISKEDIARFDKITLLHNADDESESRLETIESVVRSSNIVETTGYPRKAEQSESD